MKAAPLLVALPGNEALALGLSTHCGADLAPLELHRFPDGELRVRIDAPVAGRAVLLACCLDRPDEKMAALHFTASTLRELGATRIVLVAPYLAYLRQDRAFRSGEGTQARHYAQWLSALIDGLVCVDPHLHRIHSLREIYTVPATAISAAPAIAEWIAQHAARPLLIGPDSESAQWLQALARQLGCPYVALDKQRSSDRGVQIDARHLPAPDDRQAILLDDIIASGGTMIAALEKLRAAGYAAPICLGVHALFEERCAQALRQAGAARVLSCNSVPHVSNAVDLHPALAQAALALLTQAPTAALEHPACPQCARPVPLPAERLIEGSALRCPHCGTRAVLERLRPGHGRPAHWTLVDAGDEDEP